MKNSIKELVLNGYTVNHDYKKDVQSWAGEAVIRLTYFSGIKKIHVITTDSAPKEYPLDKIDDAIEHYLSLVETEDNLMYKFQEAHLNLIKNEDISFFDIDDHNVEIERERLKIISMQKKDG